MNKQTKLERTLSALSDALTQSEIDEIQRYLKWHADQEQRKKFLLEDGIVIPEGSAPITKRKNEYFSRIGPELINKIEKMRQSKLLEVEDSTLQELERKLSEDLD